MSQSYYIRDQAALGVLLVAQSEVGRQARVRQTVNDPYPNTIFYVPGNTSEGTTTLRDGRTTGLDEIEVCVPRQVGFSYDQPIAPGPVIELDIGSGRWYSIDEVSYCCMTPINAPMYTLRCSFGYQDPQPTT